MADVILPKLGDAKMEYKLVRWAVPDGAPINAGDLIAEIETDKSYVEIEAEDSGILRIHVMPGAVVHAGEVLAAIEESEDRSTTSSADASMSIAPPRPSEAFVPSATPAARTPAARTPAARTPAASTLAARTPVLDLSGPIVHASPLARRVARETGVGIWGITGSGPNGRITVADVRQAAGRTSTAMPPAAPSPMPAAAHANTAPLHLQAPPEPEAVELSAMRRTIARRMVESKTTIPHFYITAEIDMTEAAALRAQLNGYDDSLARISFNDMVVKAVGKALAKFPAVNAAFRDERILGGDGIHVGIAVALDDGLIVPVVRNADTLPLRQVARTARELIEKARGGRLLPAEYSGGTFTVSNLGSYDGIENFMAIVDPSQGAILAVASIQPKPVVLEDGATIAVRQRMNVTFSGDHRLMDGAVGARFLQELRRLLQNPLSLLE